MQNFIHYLEEMDAVAQSSDYDEKVAVMRRFLNEFGTHFAKTTKLGAQIIFQRRFSSKTTSAEQAQQRAECTEIEVTIISNVVLYALHFKLFYVFQAAASLAVEGYGYGVEASAEYANKECDNVKSDSAFSESETFEATVTISRGSRPSSLDEWLSSDFQPTPIQRYYFISCF